MSRKRSRSDADREMQRFGIEELKQPDHLLEYLDVERRVSGIEDIYNFASRFFQYRYVNAAYLFETYGRENRLVPIQGTGVFVCCLVDYDFPLGAGSSPPPTCLDQQIEVMAKIASWSHGRVLPFVPFDPWRWVYEGESAFTRVAQAIADGRAVGVKIYPPMGFAPAGNAELQPPFPPSWPFGDFEDFHEQLDMAMGDMLSWCALKGAPVVAHANQSNGPDAIAETLGGPAHWKRAIAAHPDLRVSFGHAGGQSLLEAVNGWPDQFANRFTEGPHVYGDWSYFESVLAPNTRGAFVKRAREFLAHNGPIAQQRIMYASDWLLLSLESGSASYRRAFEDVMERLESEFPGLAERFFVRNALDYLGLGPNGATRRRLVRFLAKNGVRAEWLDASDQGSNARAPQPGVPGRRGQRTRATKARRARAARRAG
jgi:predicted TIM-barrel fold metal-dependent hydrolase